VAGGGPAGPEGELGIIPDDPDAEWSWDVDLGPDGQPGGVVTISTGDPYMSTSRIRPVAIFDIAHYMAQPACSSLAGTGCVIKVANIIGFFVEGMCNDVMARNALEPSNNTGCDDPNRDVVGRIVTLPGTFAAGIGSVDPSAAFVLSVRLVR
jgi:hypothetical protein